MPTSLTELFSPACHLCPRRCGAARDEGARGVCGANDTLRVARAALHMWEEPPISGTNGSGTVFFSHCSLGCVFCQNRKISRSAASGTTVSIAELAKTFLSIFSIIFGTTITLLNHITLYEGFTSTLYLVILLVYAIIAFNDSIIKKLLSTIIPNIILLLITSVELNLI